MDFEAKRRFLRKLIAEEITEDCVLDMAADGQKRGDEHAYGVLWADVRVHEILDREAAPSFEQKIREDLRRAKRDRSWLPDQDSCIVYFDDDTERPPSGLFTKSSYLAKRWRANGDNCEVIIANNRYVVPTRFVWPP